MMQWLPYELHTHTFHSDGEHSLLELAASARELGLFGIALTDHNTMSPLLDRVQVQSETELQIIRGMEWTTFFGHMLALGITGYVDWRDLGIQDIHKGIERVHRQGGIVGIAHPYRVGSPLCTGCFWEYEISDWHDVDYIEVWSTTFPSIMKSNIRAFAAWTELLNRGHRITGVCGRDWHVSSKKATEPVAVAYLGMNPPGMSGSSESDVESMAVDTIRRGAVAVTMGPLLLFTVKTGPSGAEYGSGDEVPADRDAKQAVVEVQVDFQTRAGHWHLVEQELTVVLSGNLGTAAEVRVSRGSPNASCMVALDELTWLRAELYGILHNCRTMIAFANPVYFQA